MTLYSALLDKRQIDKGTFSKEQVEDRLKIARRDLEASAKMLESVHEWAYAIAYNAMLQAGRAFIFHEETFGDRPCRAVAQTLVSLGLD